MELHGAEFFASQASGIRIRLLRALSRYALKRATLIRVLSEGMRVQLLTLYGEDFAGRVRVLPPRVNLERFNGRNRQRRVGDRLRLIMVGTVNANKGQLRLISALSQAALPIDLDIVGDGPDLPACRERAATVRDSFHIRCHGRLDHEGVSSLLDQSDIFIMYSQSEGTPRAMMEAMASGLPIVTTNAGFCADIVQHGVEGFVLSAQPAVEILSTLKLFQDEPALSERMGLAAQARARRDYNADVLFQVYRDLISEAARHEGIKLVAAQT